MLVSGRTGREKAAVAVAHSLLLVIYHILTTGKPYSKLGVDYFNQLDAGRVDATMFAASSNSGTPPL